MLSSYKACSTYPSALAISIHRSSLDGTQSVISRCGKIPQSNRVLNRTKVPLQTSFRIIRIMMAEISTFKQNMSNDASQNHPITQPMRHRKEGSSQKYVQTFSSLLR